VYSPELVMLPPVVDQATAVLVVPVTAAVNCCVAPELSVTLLGEIVMAMRTFAANARVDHTIITVNGMMRFITLFSKTGFRRASGPRARSFLVCRLPWTGVSEFNEKGQPERL
jgi:hypothetical protein